MKPAGTASGASVTRVTPPRSEASSARSAGSGARIIAGSCTPGFSGDRNGPSKWIPSTLGSRRPARVDLLRSSGARDLLEMPGPIEIGAEQLRQTDQHRIEALDQTDRVRVGMIGGKRGQPSRGRLAGLGTEHRRPFVTQVF